MRFRIMRDGMIFSVTGDTRCGLHRFSRTAPEWTPRIRQRNAPFSAKTEALWFGNLFPPARATIDPLHHRVCCDCFVL